MGVVEVSVIDLVQAWVLSEADDLAVQVVTDRPLEETLPLVISVALTVNDRFYERFYESPVIGAAQVGAFPDGPVVAIDFCNSEDDLAAWAVEFALDLGVHGLDGRLVFFDPPSSLTDSFRVAPAAACTLPLDVEAMLADLRGAMHAAPYWYGSKPQTAAVVDELIPWCTTPASPGDTVVYCNGPNNQDVPVDGLPALVRLALDQPIAEDVDVTWGDRENVFRHVGFWDLARFSFSAADPGTGPVQQARTLAGLITRLAPHLESAYVRSALAGWMWPYVAEPPTLPPQPPFRDQAAPISSHPLSGFRHLMSSRVFDAYGIQLLTDTHLAHAHDLSRWDVQTVAPGRHLVQARDLDPWYAADQPDPAVLEQARADFGDMILTPAIAEAEPRPS